MSFIVISITPHDDQLNSANYQYFLNEPPNQVVKEASEEKEDESVEAQKKDENLNKQENKTLREEFQEVKEELENLKKTMENRANEVMRLLNNIMNVIIKRIPMEKQSQDSFHENNAPTVNLQRLEERMNIYNLHDG